MPDYEILVINEEETGKSAKKGEIVTYFPAGHGWKAREKSKRFAIISFTGELTEVQELANGEYVYDDVTSKFMHTPTGREYTSDFIVKEENAPAEETDLSNNWATFIDPDWKNKVGNKSSCFFFEPKHVIEAGREEETRGTVRLYWYRKFKKFAHLSGMQTCLAAVRYSDYGHFGKMGSQLPQATRNTMLQSDVFTDQDKEWLRWIWKVS
jgi:hypothetical protein